MKSFIVRRSVVVLFVVLALMPGCAGAAVPEKESRIGVLLSQDAGPYQETLDGFKRYLEQQGVRVRLEVVSLQGDAAQAGAAMQQLRAQPLNLLFTLGSLATQSAVRENSSTPIIASLILKKTDLGNAPNVTGVVLQFPVELELRWMQRLLPGQRNVGVLYNPSENQQRIDDAAEAAKTLGLTLQARKVESPRDLPDELESMAQRADVLWGLADQMIMTPQTAKPILLFSFRNRIPVVGLSQSWVKAGALYALDRDYGDIGMQCGEMALKLLRGTPVSALPPTPPRKVTYSINLKTATHMKLDIPKALIQGAREVIE
jgi:putative ABC transport system substrate-binding protein